MICNTYTQFFQTLADPAKLEIINHLKKNPLSVTGLCAATSFEQSRVSHSLRKLKNLGFVCVRPNGQQRIYDLDSHTIRPLLALIDGHVNKYYHKYCHCQGEEKKKRWTGK